MFFAQVHNFQEFLSWTYWGIHHQTAQVSLLYTPNHSKLDLYTQLQRTHLSDPSYHQPHNYQNQASKTQIHLHFTHLHQHHQHWYHLQQAQPLKTSLNTMHLKPKSHCWSRFPWVTDWLTKELMIMVFEYDLLNQNNFHLLIDWVANSLNLNQLDVVQEH
jgi:hypothetical protein